VYLKGFSMTPYQARQMINHGHIALNNRKVTIPSYMVSKDEEGQIQYTIRSPLNEISHPARPKVDTYKTELNAPTPLKVTVEEKPVAEVLPKQELTSALTAPSTQPVIAVAAPQQPSESPQKPAEEKPVKQTKKPKEHTKKEKEGAEA
jgi:ribosomal protein S4